MLTLPRGIIVGLVLIGAVYLAQLVRPLDLQPDSVCYLHTAELGAQGRGFGCPGCDRRHCSIAYPPGYPMVLAGLIRADLATPAAFVLLNIVCLGIGLVAAVGIWRRAFGLSLTLALGLSTLVLLWYPVFRLANNPLSDFLFFGLALWSVYLATVAERSTGWRKWRFLLGATMLAYAAFKVRTVGVALAPALAWAALAGPLRARLAGWWGLYPRRVILGAFALAAAGVTAGLTLRHSPYVTGDLRRQYGQGLVSTLRRAWGYRLTEFGELGLNVPVGKMPPALIPVVASCGALVVGVVFYCLWQRRRAWGAAEVFVLAVAAIMAVWPYEDARFWIPVVPLFFGLLASAISPLSPRSRWRRGAFWAMCVFVTLGLAGEVYNTRVSLAGSHFAALFADDYLGPVYREAWGMPRPADTLAVDSTAIHVLRRFEPRLR